MIEALRGQLRHLARLGPYDVSSAEGRALERQRRATLTIVANICARIMSFGLIILVSRLALEDMGVVRFGVWMTIASLISLLNFLDFGIGNGLVGPIARTSNATGDEELARLVTMGIAATACIAIVAGVVLASLSMTMPLSWLFHGVGSEDLIAARRALFIFSILLCISLPLQTVNRIFAGMQRAYITHIITFIVCILVCAGMIATRDVKLDIEWYVVISFGSLQIPGILSTLILVVERKIMPRLLAGRHVADYRPLFAVGALFLALQVGALIGWGSDQILVSALRGPVDAAIYAIAVRIFMLVSIPLYIANAPLWAAYAHAIERRDLADVKATLRRSLLGSLLAAAVLALIVNLLGREIWHLFSGGRVPYDATLMFAFAIWTTMDCTANALAMFLNGANILKPQLAIVIVFTTISVPGKIIVMNRYGISVIPLVTAGIYLATLAVVYVTALRPAIGRTLADVDA